MKGCSCYFIILEDLWLTLLAYCVVEIIVENRIEIARCFDEIGNVDTKILII